MASDAMQPQDDSAGSTATLVGAGPEVEATEAREKRALRRAWFMVIALVVTLIGAKALWSHYGITDAHIQPEEGWMTRVPSETPATEGGFANTELYIEWDVWNGGRYPQRVTSFTTDASWVEITNVEFIPEQIQPGQVSPLRIEGTIDCAAYPTSPNSNATQLTVHTDKPWRHAHFTLDLTDSLNLVYDQQDQQEQ